MAGGAPGLSPIAVLVALFLESNVRVDALDDGVVGDAGFVDLTQDGADVLVMVDHLGVIFARPATGLAQAPEQMGELTHRNPGSGLIPLVQEACDTGRDIVIAVFSRHSALVMRIDYPLEYAT